MTAPSLTIDPETLAFLREASPEPAEAVVAPVGYALRVAATAEVAAEGLVHLGRAPLTVASAAQCAKAAARD